MISLREELLAVLDDLEGEGWKVIPIATMRRVIAGHDAATAHAATRMRETGPAKPTESEPVPDLAGNLRAELECRRAEVAERRRTEHGRR